MVAAFTQAAGALKAAMAVAVQAGPATDPPRTAACVAGLTTAPPAPQASLKNREEWRRLSGRQRPALDMTTMIHEPLLDCQIARSI